MTDLQAILDAGGPWQQARIIGDQLLIQGDCREVMAVLPKVCAVVTDPPYGVLSQTGSAATRRSGGNADKGVCGWDVSLSEGTVAAVLGAGEEVMIWGGCHMALPATFGYLIWDKCCEGLNFGEVEYCWTTRRFAPRMFRYRAAGLDGGKQHPTQKPIALMEWCLGFLPDARTILDPFAGSGTTAVACQRLGRQSISIELDADYWAIMCRRVQEVVNNPPLFTPAPPKPTQHKMDL